MAREIDEAWIEEAIERHRRIDLLRAEFDRAVASTEVTVRSPDETVEVVVTAAGDIIDVRVRGTLQHRSAADLSPARCRPPSAPPVTPPGGPGRSCRTRSSARTGRSGGTDVDSLAGRLDDAAASLAAAERSLLSEIPSATGFGADTRWAAGQDRPGPARAVGHRAHHPGPGGRGHRARGSPISRQAVHDTVERYERTDDLARRRLRREP